MRNVVVSDADIRANFLRKYTKCHEKYHSFWCWHMGPFLFIMKPGAAMDKTCRRTINNMFHFHFSNGNIILWFYEGTCSRSKTSEGSVIKPLLSINSMNLWKLYNSERFFNLITSDTFKVHLVCVWLFYVELWVPIVYLWLGNSARKFGITRRFFMNIHASNELRPTRRLVWSFILFKKIWPCKRYVLRS